MIAYALPVLTLIWVSVKILTHPVWTGCGAC